MKNSLKLPISDVYVLIFLSSLFVSSLICSILLGSKIVIILGLHLSVGIFALPICFLTTDIICEVYNKEISQKLVMSGLFMQILALLFIWLGTIFPASPHRDLTEAYLNMFSLAPRMILASVVAYGISQYLDVYIFHKIKELTNSKYLWLRNNLSTMLSQFIDTLIFAHIFLFGVLTEVELLKSSLAIYIAKVFLALFDTPFVYMARSFIKKYQEKRLYVEG